MLSFGEFKASDAENIADVSVNSAQFKRWTNTATRRLLQRGDFSGTLVPIYVCIRNGCVTWPRYVGQVRKMYTCARDISVKGVWYQFLDRNQWMNVWGGRLWGAEIPYGWSPLPWGYGSPAVNQGRYPVHQDIMGDGRYVRLYHRCQQDLGKSVTIFGVDNGNQPLMHRTEAGDWQEGLKLMLQPPYAQTTTFIRRIDRVVKEETQCRVLAYAVNTNDSDVLEDLAIWEGSEISPSRLRERISVGCGCNSDSDAAGVNALIKLAYVPVRYDEDWVLIDNVDALKLMIQSVKREEAGDVQGRQEYEALAINELNQQSRNEMPDNELPIDVQPVSGVPVQAYQCF